MGDEAKKGKSEKKDDRGTRDEIESLALIVSTVPAVKTQVMIRLREAKERAIKHRENQLRKAN